MNAANSGGEEDLKLDIDFEPEEDGQQSRVDGDEGDLGSMLVKMKKVKDELEKVKKERQEYLDGWQRCKADAINSKRESVQSALRTSEMLREALVHDLIPVLDSFDIASGTEAWAEVSDGFRSGIEQVRNQLLNVLDSHGIKRFGKVGEMFDPQLHDAAQEDTDVAGEPHSIVRILRYGYKSGDRVLRPAQVVIKV